MFFNVLQPDTGPCICVHQKCLFQLFWNTRDRFSDVLSISDETTMSILTEAEVWNIKQCNITCL